MDISIHKDVYTGYYYIRYRFHSSLRRKRFPVKSENNVTFCYNIPLRPIPWTIDYDNGCAQYGVNVGHLDCISVTTSKLMV